MKRQKTSWRWLLFRLMALFRLLSIVIIRALTSEQTIHAASAKAF